MAVTLPGLYVNVVILHEILSDGQEVFVFRVHLAVHRIIYQLGFLQLRYHRICTSIQRQRKTVYFGRRVLH